MDGVEQGYTWALLKYQRYYMGHRRREHHLRLLDAGHRPVPTKTIEAPLEEEDRRRSDV